MWCTLLSFRCGAYRSAQMLSLLLRQRAWRLQGPQNLLPQELQPPQMLLSEPQTNPSRLDADRVQPFSDKREGCSALLLERSLRSKNLKRTVINSRGLRSMQGHVVAASFFFNRVTGALPITRLRTSPPDCRADVEPISRAGKRQTGTSRKRRRGERPSAYLRDVLDARQVFCLHVSVRDNYVKVDSRSTRR